MKLVLRGNFSDVRYLAAEHHCHRASQALYHVIAARPGNLSRTILPLSACRAGNVGDWRSAKRHLHNRKVVERTMHRMRVTSLISNFANFALSDMEDFQCINLGIAKPHLLRSGEVSIKVRG